jgi:hypothetical protein
MSFFFEGGWYLNNTDLLRCGSGYGGQKYLIG